ncbi:MAG: alcohol dehydrogenase catalytic domain-containing protein [Chloroflexi bacterium]|nr:alcohol dehydrogenase catalytic domain-containing protein [Chloroflexota bacterium]
MKTAMFYGGPDVRVEEVPMPEPGPDEVLVRVRAAGICGSDLHGYRAPRPGASYPTRAGHELSGEIAALGPGVTGLRVGQRVGIEPMHLLGCGTCRQCQRGDYHICPTRGQRNGRRLHSAGFSEYDIVAARNVFPLPDHVSLEEAAILDVYGVAVHGVHRLPVQPWHHVAIIGTGAVGLTQGQVARALGAKQVIVIGTRAAPLEVARACGAADAVVNAGAVDPVQAVLDLTGGAGADVVFETVGGRAPTIQQACAMAAYGGTVGVVGLFVEPAAIDTSVAMRKELEIRWVNSYSTWEGVREFQIALDLLAAGRVRAAPLITHRVPLDQIAEGFAWANDKRSSAAIKVLVIP